MKKRVGVAACMNAGACGFVGSWCVGVRVCGCVDVVCLFFELFFFQKKAFSFQFFSFDFLFENFEFLLKTEN